MKNIRELIEVNKRTITIFLTVTFPIWFFPVTLIALPVAFLCLIYTVINDLIEDFTKVHYEN